MLLSIKAPTHCPRCNSVLEWTNHLLYCRNPACASKKEKCIQHFSQTLKIKGLGPVAITKLDLAGISELYTLSFDEIALALSSERLAEKLVSEIENSKDASLNRLLPAFSIPLVGKSASEKLSKVCESIYDINAETCLKAGIGPKATENMLNWLVTDFPLLKDLPFSFQFDKPKPRLSNHGVVCISGRLKSYKTKAEATEALESKGFVVKSSLTKDVTILVNESGIESSKTNQARNSGITIVTDLKKFIGE